MQFFSMILPKLQMLDIHILGGGLYSYWPLDPTLPVDKEGDLERAVRNMKRLAVIAEDCGVTLGMEVLNRFEGYMLNTCQEGLEFIRAVDSPNVKVMLDTFHMNIEERNIGAAIRLAGKDLCHLHLGEQNRMVPGKGSLPWQEIGQAAARYRVSRCDRHGAVRHDRRNHRRADQGLEKPVPGCVRGSARPRRNGRSQLRQTRI